MDSRQQQLHGWLTTTLATEVALQPVDGDASFRRYFRFQYQDKAWVAMDCPPELEDCRPFIELAEFFSKQGLRVPKVYQHDQAQGFVLLEDFGQQLFHHHLTADNAGHWYRLAIAELPAWHSQLTREWPAFAEQSLQSELANFNEWFLQQYLGLSLTELEQAVLELTEQLLVQSAMEQPQVCIHRDYHSRNLMQLANGQVGILDFQDAALGPLTYDLVSLIRDCYIDWPAEQVDAWVAYAYQLFQEEELLEEETSPAEFKQWFDFMGMQRHLKAIFIFSRKHLRDGTDFYLQFIPRALRYVEQVCASYSELQAFSDLLNERILPAYAKVEEVRCAQ